MIPGAPPQRRARHLLSIAVIEDEEAATVGIAPCCEQALRLRRQADCGPALRVGRRLRREEVHTLTGGR